jgi:hypothetical protein
MERISRHTRSAVGGGKYCDDIMTGRVDARGRNSAIYKDVLEGWRGVAAWGSVATFRQRLQLWNISD